MRILLVPFAIVGLSACASARDAKAARAKLSPAAAELFEDCRPFFRTYCNANKTAGAIFGDDLAGGGGDIALQSCINKLVVKYQRSSDKRRFVARKGCPESVYGYK